MHRRHLLLALAVMPLSSHAVEEPDYEVVGNVGEVELRRYAPYVVAEVVLDAPAEDAGSQAFPILAGYIFGKNKGETKFAMTAPVTQAAVAGGMRVQFVLPKTVTLQTAPEPIDPRVRLRQVPAGTRAVIRYSGGRSQGNYSRHLGELKASLRAAGLATEGEPVLARYDAPYTPPFMRRNEIWLQLR